MGFLKTLFTIRDIIKNEKKRQKHYIAMSNEDLQLLNEDELYDALEAKILKKTSKLEILDAIHSLNEQERIFFILNLFDMEMQNGGLCQFYVNSSKDAAPFVSDCLNKIGATAYQKLYDDFNNQNDIVLTDLNSFNISDVDEFVQQTKRFPFDAFDDQYYKLCEMDPLNQKLVQYIRKEIR